MSDLFAGGPVRPSVLERVSALPLRAPQIHLPRVESLVARSNANVRDDT